MKCAIAALVPLKADPEDIPLNIVFEDDYVIVVNKPADMVFYVTFPVSIEVVKA